MSELSEIEQTKSLLDLATYPSLRQILQQHLLSLEAEEAVLKPSEEKAEVAVDTQEMSVEEISGPPAKDVNVSVAPSVDVPVVNRIPAKPVFVGTYIPITDFAWDQGSYNSDTVTVYIDLEGVGRVKDNCSISFTKSSFDLTIHDLNGKNYRLIKDNLDKDIIPAQSKIVVKNNKVLVKLKKVKGEYSYENWSNLTAKKKRDETTADAKKSDPMGGLMDMMKDMYEDGDDNMRKIIGEAMLKSQRGEKSEPPSMGDL
jgi:calcyclin binding protein